MSQFTDAIERYERTVEGDSNDAEIDALVDIKDLATQMHAELAALATYAAGDPDDDIFPSGSDMVDHVNEMLGRLGMAVSPS